MVFLICLRFSVCTGFERGYQMRILCSMGSEGIAAMLYRSGSLLRKYNVLNWNDICLWSVWADHENMLY